MNVGQLQFQLKRYLEKENLLVGENISPAMIFETLGHLENAYYGMCDAVQREMPSEVFLNMFSSKVIRIEEREWGVAAVSVPTFPRENNNCWFFKRATELLINKKRILTDTPTLSKNSRYTAFIRHNAMYEPLYNPPNNVESHSFLNGITGYMGTCDGPTKMDFAFTAEFSPALEESCEIDVISQDFPELIREANMGFLPRFLPENPPLEHDEPIMWSWADSMKLYESETDLFQLPPFLRMALLNDIENTIYQVRKKLKYFMLEDYFPFRKKNSKKVFMEYNRMLKKYPLTLKADTEKRIISITSNARFYNYHSYGADLILEEIGMILEQNRSVAAWLRDAPYQLKIERNQPEKRTTVDGDNTDWDLIYRLLKYCYGAQITLPVLVYTNHEQAERISIKITPENFVN